MINQRMMDKYCYIVFDKYYYKDGYIGHHHLNFRNNPLHRIDGPAIEYWDGTSVYYIEGKEYKKEEFNKYKELMRIIYD
jgi:hypothetical protein